MSPTKEDDKTAKESITPDFLRDMGISPEEQQEMENAAYSGAADDIAEHEGLSGSDLKSAEENPEAGSPTVTDPRETDTVGTGKMRNEGKRGGKKSGGLLGSRRKKLAAALAVISAIVTTIVATFFFLALKVEHIFINVEKHFMASSEKANQDMTEKLFRSYIVKKVIPSMANSKSCTTTRVNKSCVALTPGSGPVTQLYNAWRQNNLEGKLATNQGLVIRKEGNKFFMTSGKSELFSGVYDEHNPKIFEDKVYSQMSRSEVRAEMRRAFENETFAKRVMYRFKIGKLLETKYGIKRCLIACKTRDKVASSIADRKLAWKGYMIDRVISPKNEMFGIMMKCALGGFDCVKSDKTGVDGERTSDFERETRDRIGSLGLGTEDAQALKSKAEELKEKGLQQYILDKLLGETIGKVIGKAVPIVGWLDLAAQLDKAAGNIGPALKKFNYVINSTAMVSMYMMYRSNADEIKTGKVDASAVGAIADSLGPDSGKGQNGLGAESTPLYGELLGSSHKTAFISNPLSPKAYAATGYPCNDGSTITSGVCPELKLTTTPGIDELANGASAIYNSPAFAGTRISADVWNTVVHPIYNKISSFLGGLLSSFSETVIKLVPGGSDLLDWAAKLQKGLTTWFISFFVNDPLGNDPSGGRNFDMAAGGADVAGNQFAHYGLGARRISNAQAADIRLAMQQQEQGDLASESAFARMFDTSNSYSLVSRVAMAIPTNSMSGTSQSIASALTNPISLFAAAFSSRPQTASAATTSDAFGVSQYGYIGNEPVFSDSTNLETYWSQNCSDPNVAQKWGDKEQNNINPDTGMPENDIANPCALIQNGVDSAGAMFGINPDDGSGSNSQVNATANSGAGASFRIASYNIRHTATDAMQTASTNNMKSQHFDIVGMQELEDDSDYNGITSKLKNLGYAVYPDKQDLTRPPYRNGLNSRTIAWDPSKFTFLKADEVDFNRDNDPDQPAHAPVVWLSYKATGQAVIVMNTHNPAPWDAIGTEQRYAAAQAYAQKIQDLQSENIPIFFTGDFNEGYGSENGQTSHNTAGCILLAQNLMKSTEPASDVGDNINNCHGGNIDQILVSPSVQVNKFVFLQGAAAAGTDHNNGAEGVPYADITIPGTTTTASSASSTPLTVATENNLLFSSFFGLMTNQGQILPTILQYKYTLTGAL